MSDLLTTGCVLACTMGDAPASFIAMDEPGKPVIEGGFTAATIIEIIPEDNVPSFGMCQSPTNPEVIAATAAAMGVFTPAPCVPVIVDPWDPPSEILTYNGIPMALVSSTCLCAWEGEVSVDAPAEEIVTSE